MKVKLLSPDAIVPKAQRLGDAGLDVYSPINVVVPPHQRVQVKLGIAIEVEPGSVCLVQERSSQAINYGVLTIGNVIDENYRGPISVILLNTSDEPYAVMKGDRICQLLILKLGNRSVELVNELSESNRGDSGFGSSGK